MTSPDAPRFASEVERDIFELAAELFPTPPFEGTDPLAETRWDSLALEQLIAAIEEKFLVLLDREDIARPNFANVARLTTVVQRRIAAWENDD
jgi:acyl carrier protein